MLELYKSFFFFFRTTKAKNKHDQDDDVCVNVSLFLTLFDDFYHVILIIHPQKFRFVGLYHA